MPSKPRPKTFVAAVDFSACGERYAAGDVVPPGPGLRAALVHGEQFVTTERKADKPDTTQTQNIESQETPQ